MHIELLLLLVILTSLLFLFLYNITSSGLETVKINDINESFLGKKIVAEGKVKNIRNYKGHYFLEFYNSNITVVFFKNNVNEKVVSLTANKEVKVIGIVSMYKNNLEIIGEDIIYV
ncbi:MAG: exodeoxyribonuclease VII large subunit [Candidatus Aenigmatarchaeota archaeon]